MCTHSQCIKTFINTKLELSISPNTLKNKNKKNSWCCFKYGPCFSQGVSATWAPDWTALREGKAGATVRTHSGQKDRGVAFATSRRAVHARSSLPSHKPALAPTLKWHVLNGERGGQEHLLAAVYTTGLVSWFFFSCITAFHSVTVFPFYRL